MCRLPIGLQIQLASQPEIRQNTDWDENYEIGGNAETRTLKPFYGPTVFKTARLPIITHSRMAGGEGLEPPYARIKIVCLTNLANPHWRIFVDLFRHSPQIYKLHMPINPLVFIIVLLGFGETGEI